MSGARLVGTAVWVAAALGWAAAAGEEGGESMSATTKPGAAVLATRVICRQKGRYIGWPTACLRAGGELVVAFSGDRDAHVCPYGKTQIVRCAVGGGGRPWRLADAEWTDPQTVNNTPLDDRDAGVIETRRGTLLVSWFTSLAFERRVRPSWRRHVEKIGPETKRRWLGSWARRSADGGKTWGEPIRVRGSAPHGPVELSDGRLLYVGEARLEDKRGVIVVEASRDDGRSWEVIGRVPAPDRPKALRLCEPHVVEIADGRLVAMFRAEPGGKVAQYLYQSESTDGGKTWTTARRTRIWGYPPHLLRLSDGRLVVSYGRRKRPYGQRACISSDGGRTWDVAGEITVATGPNADLGYPASVELPDGTVLTVFYQIARAGEKTSLMAAQWRPPPAE